MMDSMHEAARSASGLDGTDDASGRAAAQRITAILPDAETVAPRRPARRGFQLAEAGSGLQTVVPAPIRLRRLVWILDREERQGDGHRW